MALSVLSVGAVGVIAMQKAAAIGNMRSRDLATANAIAAAWIDRLHTDAQRWLASDPTTITQTIWLSTVANDFPTVAGTEGVWFQPAESPLLTAANIEPRADVRGNDVPVANVSEAAFCTHLRVTQLMPKLIRAEVRVFWLRQGQGASGGTLGGGELCNANNAVAIGAERQRYHFVYLATGIMPTQRND